MSLLTATLIVKTEAFILILIRMSSLFIISPLLGRRNLPAIFKIGFSIMAAILLINVVHIPLSMAFYGTYEFTIAAIKEFAVGLILGYVSFLILSSIYIAGQIIDTQMGFGVVNVIDPISNVQVPITANFYYMFAMVIFITMNGHHMLIDALVRSFSVVPLGSAVFDQAMVKQMIDLMGTILVLAFKIAAPIIAASLICDVALGILSRTMPQMNIFFVGMPLKIILGLAVIMITIPTFFMIISFSIDNINEQTNVIMNSMIPAATAASGQ